MKKKAHLSEIIIKNSGDLITKRLLRAHMNTSISNIILKKIGLQEYPVAEKGDVVNLVLTC
jgi:hypothetical protein